MGKITSYPSVENPSNDDLLILETKDGTRKITIGNLIGDRILGSKSINFFVISNFDEFESTFMILEDDFCNMVPCCMFFTYDDEDIGCTAGSSIYIFDSGSNNIEDALIISTKNCEESFTAETKQAILSSENTINELSIFNGCWVGIKSLGGSYFNNRLAYSLPSDSGIREDISPHPISELLIAINGSGYTKDDNATVGPYILKISDYYNEADASDSIRCPAEFCNENFSAIIHIIVTPKNHILEANFYNENKFKTVYTAIPYNEYKPFTSIKIKSFTSNYSGSTMIITDILAKGCFKK